MKLKKNATNHDQDKYITTTQEFKKLTSETFTARLEQANLASKSDVANPVKKTDFDNQLNVFTSNKTELHELSKKAISTKGSAKDLRNKFSILNGANYFYSGKFQNYFVFIPVKYIKYFSGTTRIKL